MRNELGFIAALVVGATGGLGMTWLAVSDDSQFGALRIGAWQAYPLPDSPNVDRYALARHARRGDLPLAAGEGIAFTAVSDDAGRAFEGHCRYAIGPILPPARWWTLTLYDATGQFIDTPLQRHGYTSAEILRSDAGDASIEVSPDAVAGNWLPTGGKDFVLVLRLYDSPVSTGLGTKDTVPLPPIRRTGCT